MSSVKRAAAYIRYSSEHQANNTSIEQQRHDIEVWCKSNNAVVVEEYIDTARSARSLEKRDELKRLQRDAAKKQFEYVVYAVQDRLSRDLGDLMALLKRFRKDYGLKVISTNQRGVDDGGDEFAEMINGVISHKYSSDLSRRFKAGKNAIWEQGYWISSSAPFGFVKTAVVVGTNRFGKETIRHYLSPVPEQVAIVQRCFDLYVTGDYSMADIARILSDEGKRTVTGELWQSSAIRRMLKNEVYIGIIPHSQSILRSDGKYKRTEPQYTKGLHEAVVSKEVFDKAQTMLAYRQRVKHGRPSPEKNSYVLQGLVWCWHCHTHHTGKDTFGKCYSDHSPINGHNKKTYDYYWCYSRRKGYDCPQRKVPASVIDDQVIWLLENLRLPDDWKSRIIKNVANSITDDANEARIKQLRQAITKLDDLWLFDNGLSMSEQDFFTRRNAFMRELSSIQPVTVDSDNLVEAADLVSNFRKHFEACANTVAKNQLIRKIVSKVFIQDKEVVAVQFEDDIYDLMHLGGTVVTYKDRTTGQDVQIDVLRDEYFETDELSQAEFDKQYEQELGNCDTKLIWRLKYLYLRDTPARHSQKH